VSGLDAVGKVLIAFGGLTVVIGFSMLGLGKLLGGDGRMLPGDVVIQRPGFTFVFPIVTSIIVSAILTFALWVISTWRR